MTDKKNKENNIRRKVAPQKGKKASLNKYIKLDKKKKIILGLAVISILLIIIKCNYINLGIVFNKNITTKDAIQVELEGNNNNLIENGDEVLVFNKGELTSYDKSGKKTWTTQLESTINAKVKTRGKYIQVVNEDNGIIYLYKNKYECARIKIDGKINSSYISEKGKSVVEYEYKETKAMLGVYNSAGKLEYNIKLNNKIIGKYILSNDSRYLIYTDVDVAGISAKTNIRLIDLESKELTPSTIYTSEKSLVYDLYLDGSNLIIRLDDKYHIYNMNSKEGKDIKISENSIANVDGYKNRYSCIQVNSKGNYEICFKKMNSNECTIENIAEAPKYFKYDEDIICVCYQKDMNIYNMHGTLIKNYISDTVITEPVIFCDGTSVAMLVANKLTIVNI